MDPDNPGTDPDDKPGSEGHLTWWDAEYDDVKDADVSFYGKDNVTMRLGARFTVEVDGATIFSPYAEVNWVHNSENYGARWGQGLSHPINELTGFRTLRAFQPGSGFALGRPDVTRITTTL